MAMAVKTKKKSRPEGLKLPRRISLKWLDALGDCGAGAELISDLFGATADNIPLNLRNVNRFLKSKYGYRAAWIAAAVLPESLRQKMAPKEDGIDRWGRGVADGCACGHCISDKAASWLRRQARLAESMS